MDDFYAVLENALAHKRISYRQYKKVINAYARFLQLFSQVIFPGDDGDYANNALTFDIYFAQVSFIWKTTRKCRITKTRQLRHFLKTRMMGCAVRFRDAPECNFYSCNFGKLAQHLSSCVAWQEGSAEYIDHVKHQRQRAMLEDEESAPCA
jgi:hypothetical protein